MFIWIRATVPRLRMDQLLNFAWKFMLPMALLNLVTTGVWRFMQPGPSRWLVCAILVIVPYILLGRGLMQSKKWEKRIYRFAE
jgi:NADH-quinone oxidoreductase subunit H